MAHKPYRLVRGKSVKEWAEILGIQLGTAWKRFERGTLETYIDGNVPDYRKRHCGLTAAEIADRLGVGIASAYRFIHDGTLERRLAGEEIPSNVRKPQPIIDGMTYADCQQALGGVTKQRVQQLKRRGLLAARLSGVDCQKVGMDRWRQETAAQREQLRSQRLPGESIRQFSIRLGLKYRTVRNAFPEPVQFAKERRLQQEQEIQKRLESDKAIASQRRPGESVMQFAKRIGMNHNIVRRACGGKVPFAAERRVLEAQRIIESSTRKDN